MFTVGITYCLLILILIIFSGNGCDAVHDQICSRKDQGDGGCDAELETSISNEIIKEKEEVRLFLVGKTGSGKSATGNTILGKPMFPTSPLMRSATKSCTLKRNLRNGTMIEILDTPGLFDTQKSMREILTIIVKAVASMHPGPDAILYVVKIDRFTNEDTETYSYVKRLFDDALSKYTILLLTHGDALEREDLSLDDVMNEAPENFTKMVKEVGGRVVVFNNIAQNKQPQVDELLAVVKAMKQINKDIPYSCSRYAKVREAMENEIERRVTESLLAAETRNREDDERYHNLTEFGKLERLQRDLDEKEKLVLEKQTELFRKEQELLDRQRLEEKVKREREEKEERRREREKIEEERRIKDKEEAERIRKEREENERRRKAQEEQERRRIDFERRRLKDEVAEDKGPLLTLISFIVYGLLKLFGFW